METAQNFLFWMMEQHEEVTAETGSPRDEQLRDFAASGFLKERDHSRGTTFYEVTPKWLTALSACNQTPAPHSRDRQRGGGA